MKNLLLTVVFGMCFVFPGVVRSDEATGGTVGTGSGEIDAAFDQAEVLMAQGQHAAALGIYQQLLAALPVSARAQQAAFKAALCFEALDQTVDAVGMYDRVVTIGHDVLRPRYHKIDGQKQVISRGKPDSVRDRLETALERQAHICQALGNAAKGLQAIRQLRAVAPTSVAVVQLIPLQLQFEGRPAAEAENLIRQQQEATELYRQAQALLGSHAQETAVPILDRILADYPDTSAAIRARADKAELLWHAKRNDQSRELYQQIIDQIGQIAPDARAAQEARHRIAWLDMVQVSKALQRQVRAGESVSDVQWQRVRDACRVVMELNPDPVERADAYGVLIGSYCWQRRWQDVLSSASDFFQNYSGSRSARGRLFPHMAWVRLYKGIAFEGLSRPDEAAQEYRAILQLNADHPGSLPPERDDDVVHRATIRLGRLTGS